jgi:alkylation response protein AidB-like acyl-CoA dehydrogenase
LEKAAMDYQAPVAEQLFLLTRAAEPPAGVDPDIVEAIVEGAGAFAAGSFAPLNRIGDRVGARWSADGVTMPEGFRAAYRAYVEGGWGALAGPADQGGQGLPLTLATVLLEDLGSANLAFSLVTMLSAGAVEALRHHGSDEQKRLFLSKLVSGEWTGTMNLTEPQAGSDVGALKTRAEPVGDGSYRIAGQKIFITYGEHDLADNIVHLVLARTPDAPPGTRGITLFLVPKFRLNPEGSPGPRNDLRCVSIEHKLGIHASPTCVMAYGDGGDCLGWPVGREQEGMRAMFTMMNNARLNVGLQGVSIAERATQAAVDYAAKRIQGRRGGKPAAIIAHPDVRRMLLRMKSLTQAARALAYHAAGEVDRAAAGDAAAQARADLLIPLIKAYGTDVGVEVASIGIQVHGGMGYVEEAGAAQYLRDARIAPIYEGTNGIQAADLVQRKLGLEGGATLAKLLGDIRGDAGEGTPLRRLADLVGEIAARFASASDDDRLAGSCPYLDMLATCACGWLFLRQLRALDGAGATPDFAAMKRAAALYYLEQIVPEAIGLAAQANAGAALLYGIEDGAFAA